MSGIHQAALVTEGPDIVKDYSASITVAYKTAGDPAQYYYGYLREAFNPGYGVGSIASESGGTADYCIVYSYSADFSNPTTQLRVIPTAAWEGITSYSVTIDGVTRYDGGTFGDVLSFVWAGDPFLLRSKNGQTLALSITGVG